MSQQRKPRNNAPRLRGSSTSPPGKTGCYRCGGNHKPTTCPCREYTCHYCKKKGHIAKVCQKKDRGNQEQAHSVRDQGAPGDDTQEYVLHPGARDPYQALIKMNGHPVQMEIDTGASVSVVGEDIFKAIQRGEKPLELQKSSVQLRTYTGDEIPVRGSVLVPVEHHGHDLTLYTIDRHGGKWTFPCRT